MRGNHLKRGSVIMRLTKDLPKDAKVLPCDVLTQWKKDNEGFITRAKARLIAKGYRQQAGVHYKQSSNNTSKSHCNQYIMSASNSQIAPPQTGAWMPILVRRNLNLALDSGLVIRSAS